MSLALRAPDARAAPAASGMADSFSLASVRVGRLRSKITTQGHGTCGLTRQHLEGLVTHLVSQSVSHSLPPSLTLSLSLSLSQSVHQSVSQSVSQSLARSLTHSLTH